ncbi:PP0621 family protein [Paraburkholderia sp. J94]|uniref:PP0621 family protein n=1 Tax=Paraburkholderia sp. J94 TaxID=2805441 RepID=UPI002AB04E2C|nr:PP0621 family protein [Paraburkholderia sp. J94]
MRQIFLLILLFVVGQWFVKALRRAQTQSPQSRPGADPRQAGQGGAWRTNGANGANGGANGSNGPNGANGASGQGALPEPMVRCAECGVHAPRSESVNVGAQSFCSAEHARVYDARKSGQDRAAR